MPQPNALSQIASDLKLLSIPQAPSGEQRFIGGQATAHPAPQWGATLASSRSSGLEQLRRELNPDPHGHVALAQLESDLNLANAAPAAAATRFSSPGRRPSADKKPTTPAGMASSSGSLASVWLKGGLVPDPSIPGLTAPGESLVGDWLGDAGVESTAAYEHVGMRPPTTGASGRAALARIEQELCQLGEAAVRRGPVFGGPQNDGMHPQATIEEFVRRQPSPGRRRGPPPPPPPPPGVITGSIMTDLAPAPLIPPPIQGPLTGPYGPGFYNAPPLPPPEPMVVYRVEPLPPPPPPPPPPPELLPIISRKALPKRGSTANRRLVVDPAKVIRFIPQTATLCLLHECTGCSSWLLNV